MDENGVDKNSEQYRGLQREIADTEAQLKDLETAASKSNAVLGKISGIAQDISDKTGRWAEKTRALSAAAGGALAGLGGLAYKAVTASDDLNTLSKQSGFSTDELQKMEYAADRMDVEVEAITGAARKLKKNMASTSKDVGAAFKELGVSVKDSAGNYRNSEEVFWDTVEALGNVKDETQRDILAMQIFGKSADELAGLVDDGGTAFREMGEEAEELGIILSQDTLDNLNETNDKIDQLKARGAATFAELGAKVATVLLPIFEKIADSISNILDWFSKLDEGQVELILKILAVVAAISPLLTIISKVSGAISGITTLLPMLTSPVGIVIGVITALVAAFVILWNKCDAFREFWINLWEKVKNAFQSFKDWIEPVLKPLGEAISGTFKEAWELIKVIWAKVQPFFEMLLNGLKALFGNLNLSETFKAAWEIVKATWQNLISFFTALINTLKGIISVVKNILAGNFQGAWDAVKGIFSSWGSFFEGLIENAKKTFHKVTDIMSKPIEEGKEKIKKALELIKATFDGLKLALPKIKLPHFKISGSFSLDPPSVPKLSIDWYAKAMNYPMLLNSPTIFGAMGGKMLGAGEAGQEVVSGAETLMKMIQSAVKSTLMLSNASQSLTGTVRHTGTIRIEGVNNQGEFVAAGNAVLDNLGISGITRLVMDEIQAATDRKAAVY